MTSLDFKIKDVYSGSLVRVSTVDALGEWLRGKYATLTEEQDRCISGLCEALEEGEDPTWWAAACGLKLEPSKKKRGRKK